MTADDDESFKGIRQAVQPSERNAISVRNAEYPRGDLRVNSAGPVDPPHAHTRVPQKFSSDDAKFGTKNRAWTTQDEVSMHESNFQ